MKKGKGGLDVWHFLSCGMPRISVGLGVMEIGAFGPDCDGEAGRGFRLVVRGIVRFLTGVSFIWRAPSPSVGWSVRVGAWVSSFWLFPWLGLWFRA